MINPAPAVYAGSSGVNETIAVDGEMLVQLAADVQPCLDDISTDIDTVFKTLSDLKLGWAGKTADEAQAFIDRLDACMTLLFGKAGDTTSWQTSMLYRVTAGLGIAGSNYLAAEDAIVDLFYGPGAGASDTDIWNAYNAGVRGAKEHQDNPTLAYDPQDYAHSNTWHDVQDPTQSPVSETF